MRVFWDTMLFIYLLQGDEEFGERVVNLRKQSLAAGDTICTSALALGEVLAGVHRDKTLLEAEQVRSAVLRGGVVILPFDERASDLFGRIRATHRTSAADSIHLACAAIARVDLFLTGDKKLLALQVPGIASIEHL